MRITIFRGTSRRSMLSICVVLLVICPLFRSAAATEKVECSAPLPIEINIKPPPQNIPESLARFHGFWGNERWNGLLCNLLFLEVRDNQGSVTGIYSWGDSQRLGISSGYINIVGTITGSRLTLSRFSNGAEVTYNLTSQGLQGTYLKDGVTSYVTLIHLSQEAALRGNKVRQEDIRALVGKWEGKYVFKDTGDGGYSTLWVHSINEAGADVTIEWRWPVQRSDSTHVTAALVRDEKGRIIGIEPWRGSRLMFRGNRLVGDLKMIPGIASHTFEKD
ncbi:hypothetical protein SAMN06265365_104171 [Tistlia consotensis]|uniref:Uncharacterized protein n=1 Tax=Tistlia consotensis USBA 355 TaxID=560819 RepID=A0A1Y6BPD3_9PROT|nr:hypothetical protein [Tistlia consotensis]SMF21699.1 hypothetical protein SAMN05428998_107123 [Tistlia consotensis USBA 355]SNR46648.1 hypothetical protein SAMN06265365_104171 [Tistlia consotensis]